MEEFSDVLLLEFLLVTDLDPWDPATVHTLIIHLDVSLNIPIINLAFMFGHQATLPVALLVPGLLDLPIQLLPVLIHPLLLLVTPVLL